ncbi:MAG: hypothetical protein NZ480_00350 [Bdellovibrionaceae bacterium]|nr:hypothetical protein [Pseudobdellovibrionaceae bacterium]MDW8190143.1 hypothetical protein [Pseudobdellovibrionaceae bacterium]
MKPLFCYCGPIESSKSQFNRALIIKSFFPDLIIEGKSSAQDVQDLKSCVEKIISGKPDFLNGTTHEFWVGEGGTVLRFLLARLSRQPGSYSIKGTPRLLQRPHHGLMKILVQLGVKISIDSNQIQLISSGWQIPQTPILLPFEQSSQFASALLLACWKLPQPITLDLSLFNQHQTHSASYFLMTINLLNTMGMNLRYQTEKLVTIEPSWTLAKSNITLDPDWSSLATLIVAAWLAGQVEVPLSVSKREPSFDQPDSQILQLFAHQQPPPFVWDPDQQKIKVTMLSSIPPFNWNFEQTPDLLPSLSVLASFAEGHCHFRGWQNVRYKESDRLLNAQKLLTLAGVNHYLQNDEWIIEGKGPAFIPRTFSYDPDQDHRMAMAAALFRLKNKNIVINNYQVVKKSFPQFWKILFPHEQWFYDPSTF